MRFRVIPFLLDLFDVAADADPVNLPVGGEDADGDRNVVAAALAVDDVLEQKRLALGLRNTAAELPAHQRMHLAVLVDRPLDADEQALFLQRRDVRVQVGVSGILHAFLQPFRAGLFCR